MDFGTAAEQYRQNLIDLTNNCHLTMALAYYVAKDFFRDLEESYKQTLKEEAENLSAPEFETTETINADELMRLDNMKQAE